MRKKIIAGNWKMNKNVAEGLALVEELKAGIGAANADVVVIPPFTALYPVGKALAGSPIALGAQNLFWKASGAYTSQEAPGMLTDVSAAYVLVGHSETRGRFGVPEPDFDDDALRYFGELDSTVNRKTKAAIAAGLTPIVCVGETLAERQAGQTDSVVRDQAGKAIAGIDGAAVVKLVFAYEPVWAIGTGEVCGADEADRVCGEVRGAVKDIFGDEVAEAVRIQYGGSMKPDNAAHLLAKPNIDGGLVGGACLKASDFLAIIKAAG